jgi:hypothetical protein
MTVVDIEKLNQLISRTDISGNDKVEWLIDFIDGRELQQQQNSYSEEEVEEIFKQAQLCAVKSDGVYFKYETFEQFKKKQNETNSSRMD